MGSVSNTFSLTITSAPMQGVLLDGLLTCKVLVVGDDPGVHGLHYDHTHPPRNFPATTKTMAQSGLASDPATWSPPGVPTDSDVVVIPSLSNDATKNTEIRASIFVTNKNGSCAIRCPDPTKTFLHTIPDIALDPVLDPQQWGNVFGAVGGTLIVEGAPKLSWCELDGDPYAGMTSIVLSQPATGWQVGDELCFEDLRKLEWEIGTQTLTNIRSIYNHHAEKATVAAISANKLVITLVSPLQFDHLSILDVDGTVMIRPAVGNLTRNVKIVSANPVDSTRRGHVLYHGRADVTERYVEFRDTGRSTNDPFTTSNIKGRYGNHRHHLIGPVRTPSEQVDPNVWQSVSVGNSVHNTAVDHSFRWGMVYHAISYALCKDNVVYNYRGWGVGTEDGTEIENRFENNFVCLVPGLHGTGVLTRGTDDIGHEGVAFWFANVRNRLIGGRGMSCTKGVSLVPNTNSNPSSVKQPAYKGADHESGDSTQYVIVDIEKQAVLEVDGTIMVGRHDVGFDFWNINSKMGQPIPGSARSVCKNLRIARTMSHGVYNYQTTNFTLDGFIILDCNYTGVFFSDYTAEGFEILNSNIQKCLVGIYPNVGSGQVYRNNLIRCWRGVDIHPVWVANNDARMTWPRTLLLDSNRFQPSGLPGNSSWGPEAYISYKGRQDNGDAWNYSVDLTIPDVCTVLNHQGVAGDNFRMYYPEQAASYIMPPDVWRDAFYMHQKGCPVAGLTNQQSLAQYGVCFAGKITPTNTVARSGIIGDTEVL